jgi:protein-disulfide isomerase
MSSRKPGRTGTSPRKRPPRRDQPWREKPRRSPLLVWGGVAVLVVAVVAGIAIQSSRSVDSNAVVAPQHSLGPGGGEQLGSPSAPVLLEEYGDFQCPACAALEARLGPTIKRLAEDGKIRFVFHQFAFIGPESQRAASASTCAGDQGKFWPYHDLLYAEQAPENSGALTTDRLLELGRRVGLTDDRFTSCVRDDRYVPWVRQVTDEGSRRGVNGTPALFLNDKELPLDQIQTPQDLERVVNRAASG